LSKLDLNTRDSYKKPSNITPNIIVNRIINLSRVPLDKTHSKVVISEILRVKYNAELKSEYARDFTIKELTTAIKSLKNEKAAGTNELFPEVLKNCSPRVTT
jgi:hypothetical protein